MKLKPTARSRSAVFSGVAALVLFAALAGCGGGSKEASSSSDVDKAGLQQARSMVKEFSKRPTEIPNKTPIDKPVPTGKTITFLSAGTSTSNLEYGIIKQAGGFIRVESEVGKGSVFYFTMPVELSEIERAPELHPEFTAR